MLISQKNGRDREMFFNAVPLQQVHEHWTDTDVLNNQNTPNEFPAEEGLGSQWGEPAPAAFIGHASP